MIIHGLVMTGIRDEDWTRASSDDDSSNRKIEGMHKRRTETGTGRGVSIEGENEGGDGDILKTGSDDPWRLDLRPAEGERKRRCHTPNKEKKDETQTQTQTQTRWTSARMQDAGKLELLDES